MSLTGILFKNVYENFIEFTKGIFSTNLLKGDLTDFDEYVYNILYNKYCNNVINYDTIDAFNRHFVLEYINNRKKYLKIFEILDKVYNLHEEDFIDLVKNISNFAAVPNIELSNPLNEIVNYLTTQNSGVTKGNKFEQFTDSVKKMQDNYFEEFCMIFNKHFRYIL